MDMTRQQLTNNYVDTLILKKSTFSKQVNCNGKLRAVAKSELTMPGAVCCIPFPCTTGVW